MDYFSIGINESSQTGLSIDLSVASAPVYNEITVSSELARIQPLLNRLQPLEWSDKAHIENAITQHPQRTSELTFVNLFAWAPIQYPRWANIEGHVVVSYDPGDTGESVKFLPPIGPNPSALMEKLSREYGAVFARVDIAERDNLSPDVATVVTPNDHDYLYTVEQIQELKGSKSSELRRRLGKFTKNVGEDASTAPITAETIADAKTVVDCWLTERIASSGDTGKIDDANACNRILERWDELPNLRGSLVYHKGVPVSLAIGELVHPRGAENPTLIVHFEKSVISRELEGLPVFSFQKLCSDLPKGCVINRMQSAGVEGLQKWKESWGPLGQLEKILVG
jgi:hypothetical protein